MTGVQTCALPICFPVTIYELSLDIEEDDFTRYLNVRIKELEELSGLEIGNIEYHVLDIICNYNKENN